MSVKEKSLALYLSHCRIEDASEITLPLFVKIMDSQNDCEDHTHDFAELVIVHQGTGVLVCNHVSRMIAARDVFVIPPGACHRYEQTAGLSLANLMFDPRRLPMPKLDLPLLPGYHALFMLRNEFFADQKTFPGFTLAPELYTAPANLLQMMREECQKQQPGVNFRLMGLFMALLGTLAAAYPETAHNTPRQSETGQLCKLVAFMNREFRRKIDFAELLEKVPMSRSTLNRNFVRATGETPMRYLLKLRLEHAASLLAHTDTSIAEIAIASGFEDSNYFSRAFRKVYHLSPREFRALLSSQA